MSMFTYLVSDINNKLSTISTLYPNDCINILSDDTYMTSTEISGSNIYIIHTSNASVHGSTKVVNNVEALHIGLAMLQY